MSSLGHVLNLTSFSDDFRIESCLRSLQRQGFRCAAHNGRGQNLEGNHMSTKRVPIRVRAVAAALAIAALLAGGVAATETAAGAGRGLANSYHAGRGL